jgi:hypothetical protein
MPEAAPYVGFLFRCYSTPVVHAASRLHDGYMAPHILYGVPHSLYTGKSRAYLRKQGFTYVERTPADPRFRAEIVPRIGRGIIPVLVTPDGEVIQDTVDILDHFEDRGVPVSARASACWRMSPSFTPWSR